MSTSSAVLDNAVDAVVGRRVNDTRPPAYLTFRDDFRAGAAVVFSFEGGGTLDYVTPQRFFPEWLAEVLGGALPNGVLLSLDEGLTFPNEACREQFEVIMGLAPPVDPLDDAAKPRPPAKLSREPEPLVRLVLEYLKRAPKKTAFAIIDRADLLVPPGDVGTLPANQRALLLALSRAGTDKALERRDNPLFLLSPSTGELHPELLRSSNGIRHIDVPMPDEPQRLGFIRELLDQRPDLADLMAISPEALAGLTAGLYLRQIEDIALRALRAGEPISPSLVFDLKAEMILATCGGTLRLVKPKGGLDMIGGNTAFKAWVKRYLIDAVRAGDVNRIKRLPLAILLAGPPGTGKSTIAECLAYEMGWNCFISANVKDKYVGESEKRERLKQEILRANTPFVLFEDEVDQLGGRVTGDGGGGSSVDAAIFQMRLTLMADTTLRSRALFLGATNRPDVVDDALVSRYEVRVPILPPEDDFARADILARLYDRNGVWTTPESLFAAASVMDDWSGRDMEQTVNKALILMDLDGLDAPAALLAAANTRRPMQRADSQMMTKLAIADCNDLELLPERYRQQAGTIDRAALAKDIASVRTARSERDLDL